MSFPVDALYRVQRRPRQHDRGAASLRIQSNSQILLQELGRQVCLEVFDLPTFGTLTDGWGSPLQSQGFTEPEFNTMSGSHERAAESLETTA